MLMTTEIKLVWYLNNDIVCITMYLIYFVLSILHYYHIYGFA